MTKWNSLSALGKKGESGWCFRESDSRARRRVRGVLAGLMGGILFLAFAAPAAVLDDFEDGDLEALGGWEWRVFAKEDPYAFTAQVVDFPEGRALVAEGIYPDDGTGLTFGGLTCAKAQRGRSEDLRRSWGISFRVAGKEPGYFYIRLEQEGLGHNSSNVIFPVTEQMEQIVIPFDRFETGVARTYAITFTRIEDVPGEPFYLRLDDVEIHSTPPREWQQMEWKDVVTWASSLSLGWQDARFSNKPMLVYFWSQYASPCLRFEAELFAEKRLPGLASQFVMAKLNVNEHQAATQRYNVLRVPSFLAFEPSTGEHTVLYVGEDPGALQDRMESYLAGRDVEGAVARAAPTQQFTSVTIDTFDDRNQLNEVGGRWAAFSAGDRGDISCRFIDLGGGNVAIEAVGMYPYVNVGATFGGVYCDLSPERRQPRNLTQFRWLAFVCRTDRPRVFQVHLEDSRGMRSVAIRFQATNQPTRITIPVAQFGGAAQAATTIVWSEPAPTAGDEFRLALDDVMFVR